MHPKERYEEIITGKLAALPLPDMADAIWARIDQQLDMDLPEEEGGDVPEPSSPWGGGGIAAGTGLFVVMGALLAIFYYQQPKKSLINPSSTNTSNEQTVTQQDQTLPPTDKVRNAPRSVPYNTAAPLPGRSQAIVLPQQDSAVADIAVSSSAAPVPDSDSGVTSMVAQPNIIPAPATGRQDSVPKKRRGLQGINDKDYRIVPKQNNMP